MDLCVDLIRESARLKLQRERSTLRIRPESMPSLFRLLKAPEGTVAECRFVHIAGNHRLRSCRGYLLSCKGKRYFSFEVYASKVAH
mmetsp:Transcript_55446/g.179893  ORF Transcript_55446/g.179893 Transcript_55446/m.179893 type:complete len:86 (-) Transcript_55446:123-380(-)